MNYTPTCRQCGRLIRADSRAYAANGGFFHWECTEPPAVTIKTVDVQPGDTLVLESDRWMTLEQQTVLRDQIEQQFGLRALVLFGIKLQAVMKGTNVAGEARPTAPQE